VAIPAGNLIATLAVLVLGDLLDEPDEDFSVQLTGAEGGVLAVAVADGTILDDDDPPILSITGATVTEAPGAELVFTVALSAVSGFEVTVDYQTADETAVAGLDYAAGAGTLSLPAGTTSATVRSPSSTISSTRTTRPCGSAWRIRSTRRRRRRLRSAPSSTTTRSRRCRSTT